MSRRAAARVRATRAGDFPGIIRLCRAVYPDSAPWTEAQLASHLRVFPEGQLVAVAVDDGAVVGMAASLIVLWDDYTYTTTWRELTAAGTFANHDPVRGRTLYGAEVMVDPAWQGRGVGTQLYAAREALARRLGLLRIRAGARLRGYQQAPGAPTVEAYVSDVIRGARVDPTLTFQLRRGFRVLAVAPGYLAHDPESQGHAAVIEWLNPDVARPEDATAGDPRFRAPPGGGAAAS